MLLAKQPLYQLSYTPDASIALVGLTRIELVTSSLSGTRSNQLSYKPIVSMEETWNMNVCAWRVAVVRAAFRHRGRFTLPPKGLSP